MTCQMNLITTLAVVTLLSGCSVRFAVDKSKGDRTSIWEKPGIYYALPKTEVLVAVPVKTTKTRTGRYFEKWDDCVSICIGNQMPADASCEVNDDDSSNTYSIEAPTIKTRSVADYENLYSLDPDFEDFTSSNHTVEINERGILSSTTSETTDHKATAVLNLLDAIAKSAVSSPLESNLKEFSRGPETANETDGSEEPGRETCSVFLRSYKQLEQLAEWRNKLDLARDKILAEGLQSAVSDLPAYLGFFEKLELGLIDLPGADVERELGKSFKEVSTSYLATRLIPLEGAALVSEQANWRRIEDVDWLSLPEANIAGWKTTMVDEESPPDIIGTDAEKSQDQETIATIEKTMHVALQENYATGLAASLQLAVKIDPYDFPPCDPSCPEAKGTAGYRYRIPARGFLRVTGKMEDAVGKPKLYAYEALLPVAQYGPIAALPHTIGGRRGKIALATHEDTGGLKTVTLENDAVPAELPGQTISALAGFRTSSAEETSQTIADLENRKTILTLEQEIRDLEKAAP